MLQHLSIENFAIIEKLDIDFEDGMTVLTGETGAGKSIIIDAVSLLIGGRGSTHYIRYGEEKFFLRGIFFLPEWTEEARQFLKDNHIPLSENELLISRELDQRGKNTIRVNDVTINVTLLKKLGRYLVDIHGQNEHQLLMDERTHLNLLDAYESSTILPLRQAYEETYLTYQEAKKAYQDLTTNEQEMAQRVDLLTFQIKEIEEASLEIGEEEKLEEEQKQLENYQGIVKALSGSRQLLGDGEENLSDGLAQVMDALQRISALDQDYQNFYEQVSNAYYIVEELYSDIDRKLDELSYDPQRLDLIGSRLMQIQQLKRKYGEDEEAILSYLEQAKVELDELTHYESYKEELKNKYEHAYKLLAQKGIALHEARIKASKNLNKEIDQQLSSLYMSKAHFRVHFEESDHFRKDGKDIATFYLSTNAGEPFQPLVKIASGGEMSRIMLSLKTIFQEASGMTAIVFDEVDTGVSGRVAQAIANKMYEISTSTQVLSISHLPQVAAIADYQYHISKQETKEGRTITMVHPLEEDERIEAIAHMSSGEEVSQAAEEAAKALLSSAKKWKETKHED